MRKGKLWAVACTMLVVGLFACGGGGTSSTSTSSTTTSSTTTSSTTTSVAPTYSLSGTVTLSGAGLQGVTMTLGSPTTPTTDANGNFTLSGLVNGNYSITPNKLGYAFTPTSATITINGMSVTGQNFTSTAIASTPFNLRGFNITAWSRDQWSSSQPVDLALQFAKDEGANMLVMDWAVNFNDDGTMVGQGGPNHPIWQDIFSLIANAKARGFYIILKPHVTMATDPNNRNSWNTDVKRFLPSNFFSAWQQYLNNLGKLASASGVDSICIGTENNHIDWKFRDDWVALIKSLRSNFLGALTYDSLYSQWSNTGSDENNKDIRDVVFWDLMDFVACSFYVTLTQDDNASVDTLRQLFTNNPYGNDHDPIGQLRSISEKYGKQIITLEGGYQSCNGGLWDVVSRADINKTVNNDLQARGLDAYLWALNVNKQNWLKGCSLWEIMPSLILTQSIWHTQGFSVYGKPAADVVKRWFTLTQ